MENENKPEENSGTGERLRIEPVEKILAEMEKFAEQKGVGVEVSTLGYYARQIRAAIEDERIRWIGAVGRAGNVARPNASSPALATMREMLDMLDHVKELLQGPGSYPGSVCKLRDDIAAAASKIASAEALRIVGGEEVRT